MARLVRGLLKIYGSQDTRMDARPVQTISLCDIPGAKVLLGIKDVPPSGFELKVSHALSHADWLKFAAVRASDCDAFLKALRTEWRRVNPDPENPTMRGGKQSPRTPRTPRQTQVDLDKENLMSGKLQISNGPGTLRLFGLTLRSFLVYACEKGGVAALGKGDLGPITRKALLSDSVKIDEFHECLCKACKAAMLPDVARLDSSFLLTAALAFFDLAGYKRDARPRASQLLQRLSLGAVLLRLAEVGASLSSLELWLQASKTGTSRRLCQICEDTLSLAPREALAMAALSAPLPETLEALTTRFQVFSRAQIFNSIPKRMWSKRTIRAAVAVLSLPQGKRPKGSVSAEAPEIGLYIQRRLLFEEALFDPRDPMIAEVVDLRIDHDQLNSKEESKDSNATDKKQSKLKQRKEAETDGMHYPRLCLKKFLPNVLIKRSTLKAGEEPEDEKNAKDAKDEDEDAKEKNDAKDEDAGAKTMKKDKEDANTVNAKAIHMENYMEWLNELLNASKHSSAVSKLGMLVTEVRDDSPRITFSVLEAIKQSAAEHKLPDDEEGNVDEHKVPDDEHKLLEKVRSAPSFVLLELHEVSMSSYEVRASWQQVTDTDTMEKQVDQNGEWQISMANLDDFTNKAETLWEEHAESQRKARAEAARQAATEAKEAKQKTDNVRKSQIVAKAEVKHENGHHEEKSNIRGSVRPGEKQNLSKKSVRPGETRASVRPGETRASVRPGATRASVRPGEDSRSTRGSVRPGTRASVRPDDKKK